MGIEERVKRLGEVAEKMPRSIEIYREITGGGFSEKTIGKKQEFFDRRQDLELAFGESLEWQGEPSKRDEFLEVIEKIQNRNGKDYISAIKGLKERESNIGNAWLQGLVDEITGRVWGLLPSFGIATRKRQKGV
jgi:hypothetical protein